MSSDTPPEYEFVHVLESSAQEGSARALDELLSFYDRILRAVPGIRDAELSEYPPLFEPLGRLLNDKSLQTRICGWLRPLAPRFSDAQRETLRISFLELWPVEPVSWSTLEAIWMSFWNSPETRWVVLDAYNCVPLKFKFHYQKFAEIARAAGQELAPLDERQHAEWLRDHSRDYDRAEIAAYIESILAGEGRLVWDEIIHQPLIDPELEAVRERCARLDATSQEGREILRHELRMLRA